MTTKPCYACAEAATRPICGSYSFSCVGCCARLVMSARPLRGCQEAALDAITRNTFAPTRAEILEKIKGMT
jgi:hypothetical protein